MRPIRTYLLLMALITGLGLPARKMNAQLPSWYVLYFGDYLWAMLLFFIFGLTFRRVSTFKVAAGTLAFIYVIEISQLFHPHWQNIRHTKNRKETENTEKPEGKNSRKGKTRRK